MIRKLKILVLLLAFLFLLGGVGAVYLLMRTSEDKQASDKRLVEAVEVRENRPQHVPDLGRKKQWSAAMSLLESGEALAARDRLYYLIDYFPESEAVTDARRVIGEINADLVLSTAPIEGKQEYRVKSGDALLAIAKRHDCTIDFIMRANERMSTTIFPGDRLVVYPLNFSVKIEKSRGKVVLEEPGGRLFKEYPVVSFAFPPGVGRSVKTEVTDKVAWVEDRRVRFNDPEYFGPATTKWLQTGRQGLVLRSVSDDEAGSEPATEADSAGGEAAEEAEFGVLLAREDVEELFALVRGGTPVRLVD